MTHFEKAVSHCWTLYRNILLFFSYHFYFFNSNAFVLVSFLINANWWRRQRIEVWTDQTAFRRNLIQSLFSLTPSWKEERFHDLEQWFSTFGSWRPTKYNNTQFGDPYITNLALKHRFWQPKSKVTRPKVDRDPPVENH